MELFNESCIFTTTVIFYLFTDYVDDSLTKWNAGWMQVALILFNFLVNVIYIVFQMTRMVMKKFWKNSKCFKKTYLRSHLGAKVINNNKSSHLTVENLEFNSDSMIEKDHANQASS